MKNNLCTALLLAAAMTTLTPSVPTSAADLREHRAVWVTPFLSDWPTSAITTGNAANIYTANVSYGVSPCFKV